ncbi:oligopeptide/dipeptide ABC transporter ATP-binding protein [Erysipelothrix urinaevulpis]|uniref:oligopeptide/dipeptide ABC transporter ATP-binding protein n=1 Tax=Erysipelothrix urinaevulpis TaxID=2683717 RepID=UPI00135C18EC|nr:oligopeptide/dipeptide ABC transporter ATP-binding protein [Erysipelothrix urinaevulpis]
MTTKVEEKALLKVEHLQKYFPIKKSSVFQKKQDYVKANKDISIEIKEGETLGLVGESGCGKSTFGRTLIQLYDQTGGVSLYYGETIEEMMPKYVLKAYKSIPKVMASHNVDIAELNEIETRLLNLKGEEFAELNEELRLKKIAYEDKYGNVLRLAGGLLVSDNLNAVSKVLEEKYQEGSKVAELNKKIEIETLKREMRDGKTNGELDKLKAQRDEVNKKFTATEEKVLAMKKDLESHAEFEFFESKLDSGIDLSQLTKNEMRFLRKDLQIIFQDPYSSLDPRFTVGNIIGEGLIAHGLFKDNKSDEFNNYVIDIMEKCGLNKEFIHRYPHQFSGGQRQRIGIARALALKPRFIVCDEAVSALDVSIQSQVINLLQDLKDEHNLTYLFITHDLGVVRYISDRIGVMYFGNLVELAPAEEIFNNPQHPYTKQLLAAIPRMDRDEEEIKKLLEVKPNDIFDFKFQETGEADKDWYEVAPDHFVACRLLDGHANKEVL